jgi:hypothetical protein
MTRTSNSRWNDEDNGDDDDVSLVLDPYSRVDVYKDSSLKQQYACRHVTPLGHINLNPSLPGFAVILYCCVLSGETAYTNYIVFGLTRPGFEPTICHNRRDHAEYYTTEGSE